MLRFEPRAAQQPGAKDRYPRGVEPLEERADHVRHRRRVPALLRHEEAHLLLLVLPEPRLRTLLLEAGDGAARRLQDLPELDRVGLARGAQRRQRLGGSPVGVQEGCALALDARERFGLEQVPMSSAERRLARSTNARIVPKWDIDGTGVEDGPGELAKLEHGGIAALLGHGEHLRQARAVVEDRVGEQPVGLEMRPLRRGPLLGDPRLHARRRLEGIAAAALEAHEDVDEPVDPPLELLGIELRGNLARLGVDEGRRPAEALGQRRRQHRRGLERVLVQHPRDEEGRDGTRVPGQLPRVLVCVVDGALPVRIGPPRGKVHLLVLGKNGAHRTED